MQPIEIIVIIVASLIVASVIITAIIRKIKGKSSCGCDCSACPHSCHPQKKK